MLVAQQPLKAKKSNNQAIGQRNRKLGSMILASIY